MNDAHTPDDLDRPPVPTPDQPTAPEVPPAPPVPSPASPVAEPAPAVVRRPDQRSPTLAAFLAVVPGLGQLYVGAYQRAAMLIATFFLAIYLLPLPVSVFIPIFIWFFGIFDAYRQAQLVNQWGEGETARSRPRESGLAFGVFLLVVGAVLLIDNFYPIDLYWLREWWPAILVAVGAYLIGASFVERARRRREEALEDDF